MNTEHIFNSKDVGPTVLHGLPATAYSQARSHYCLTRELLPAAFMPWACASLLRQPGCPAFRRDNHIDAKLSADA